MNTLQHFFHIIHIIFDFYFTFFTRATKKHVSPRRVFVCTTHSPLYGGQVVSMLVFYAEDPSSNLPEVYNFSVKMLLKSTKMNKIFS